MKLRWYHGVALLLLVGAVITVAFFLKEIDSNREPEIVFWSDERYGNPESDVYAIRELEDDLGTALIDVDFSNQSLIDCLEEIETSVRNDPEMDPIRFHLDSRVDGDQSIQLQLEKAPLRDALRSTLVLAQVKYRTEADRVIGVYPLEEPDKKVAGWIHAPNFILLEPEEKAASGPIDAKAPLENAGISFTEGDIAEFHPDKDALWVVASMDEMELIDTYATPMCAHYIPTWSDRLYDRLYEGWWKFTSLWKQPLPPSSPSPSISTNPDPFGGLPAQSAGSPPDPFK